MTTTTTNAYLGWATRGARGGQAAPIPGRTDMVPNNAGGWGFALSDTERLDRFLVLGSEGGTYYVNQEALTTQNAAVLLRALAQDGPATVARIVDISEAGRAPKNTPALFALALALRAPEAATRQAAEAALPRVARTGTHLLQLAAMLHALGGWSRSRRRALGAWFTTREPAALGWQALKYAQRDGFALRDVLRLAHPKAPTPGHAAVFDWICGRKPADPAALPATLAARDTLHRAVEAAPAEARAALAAAMVAHHNLPREAVPSAMLATAEVWRALLPSMPMMALLRGLAVLTRLGVLAEDAAETAFVAARLADSEAVRRARLHPFQVFLAAHTYARGHGLRGQAKWTPVPSIIDALEACFDASFGGLAPTGQHLLVAIDVSGSMSMPAQGAPVSCADAAAAMAVAITRREPNATVLTFDTKVRLVLHDTHRLKVSDLLGEMGGGTDLAQPVLWARAQGLAFDGIVVLTDNETWAGHTHPAEALAEYRRTINPAVKLVCCAMAANHANVVDPTDAGSLGIAGLDAAVPALVAEFLGQAAPALAEDDDA
jgi:60 kDa SS-A/Ro ribonucleoprotein